MDVCIGGNFVQNYIFCFVGFWILAVIYLLFDGQKLREQGHPPFFIFVMVSIFCFGLIWALASSVDPVAVSTAECQIIIGG